MSPIVNYGTFVFIIEGMGNLGANFTMSDIGQISL
jgi:hypothetical protein